MRDLSTILWKEWRGSLLQGGGRAWIRPGLLIAILGIAWPLLGKLAWMELSPLQVLVILFFSFSVVTSIIADSVAGERERHTLETLLASRIPDRAIALGKVAAVVLYSWALLIAGLCLGALVCSLAYAQGRIHPYPTDRLLFTLGLSLLVDILGATLGLLISMRTSTVRQAQQTVVICTIALGVSAALLAQFLAKQPAIAALGTVQALLLVGGLIAVADLVLLSFSLRLFRRKRLFLQ
jgi:ABC-2 type transport system permease protein